jgi:hypothetical protein
MQTDSFTDQQHDLARRLIATARAIGEPCGGAQCWLDLRDEFPSLTEQQARDIINAELRKVTS